MSCKCARVTDEWHGWECTITEGACMFLFPDSKACAEEFGEGPDAEIDNSDEEMDCLGCSLDKERACADCCRDWDNEDED